MGIVTTELRELVDDLRSCLDASEMVGELVESTGEGAVPCMLKVGEIARMLVGDDVVSLEAKSAGTVVRGASGAGFAGPIRAP